MAIANASMIRTGGIASRVFAGVGLAALGMGFVSIRAAASYEQAMNIVEVATGANDKEMKRLSATAIKLGKDFKLPNVSAKDAANSMVELGKAGLNVNTVIGATRGVLQLGLAANIEFSEAAVITARALKAFGLEGKEATRVANLLAAGSLKSTAEISDLAFGLQNAGAQFKSAGYDMETLVTALSELVDSGLSGEYAGTALKTMLIRLQSPTKEAAAVMKELGVNVYDAGGKMKPLPVIIEQFGKAFKGASEQTKAQALNTIFGVRANQAMFKLLDGGVKTWYDYYSAIYKTNAAQQIAEARTKGVWGAAGALGSAIETLAIQLGTALLPALEKGIRGMANFVANIDPNRIISFVTAIKDAVAGPLTSFVNFLRSDLGQTLVAGALGIWAVTKAFYALKAGAAIANTALFALKGNPIWLALIPLGLAVGEITKKWIEGKIQAQNYANALANASIQANALKDSLDRLKGTQTNLKAAKLELIRATDDLKVKTKAWRDEVQKSGGDSVAAKEKWLQMQEAQVRVGRATQGVTEATKQHKDAERDRTKALELGNKEMWKLHGFHKLVQDAFGVSKKNTDDFAESMRISAREAGKKSLALLKMGDIAGSKTAAKVALLAQKAVELTEKYKKIPDRKEIVTEAKEVNFQKFFKALLNIERGIEKTKDKAKEGGTQAGSGMGEGIYSGIGQWIGSVVARAREIVAVAVAAAQAQARTGSASKETEEKVGKPLGEGLITGMLAMKPGIDQEARERVKSAISNMATQLQTLSGIISIPLGQIRTTIAQKLLEAGTAISQAQLAEKMSAALDRMVAKVQAKQELLASAFRRLADYALRAFDARTQAGLDQLDRQLQARLKKIDDDLAKALKKIQATQAKKTPAEAELERLDKAEAERQRQTELGAAEKGLAEAQAGGDPQAILDAEERLRQAKLAITRAGLEEQAKIEREAADAKAARDTAAAEEEARKAGEWQTKKINKKKLDYSSERALLREAMELFLTQQEQWLMKHPAQWDKVHQRIMKKFKNEFGPDFKRAGKLLGEGYVDGLQQSFKRLDSVAEQLAKLIAQYLKGSSPPPKGPLHDIDKWGETLINEFLGGFDTGRINSALDTLQGQRKFGAGRGSNTLVSLMRRANSPQTLVLNSIAGYTNTIADATTKTAQAIGDLQSDISSIGEMARRIGEGETSFSGTEVPPFAQSTANLAMPDWADPDLLQRVYGALGSRAGELSDAIMRGNVKTNARLLEIMYQMRSRYNWGDVGTWGVWWDQMKEMIDGGMSTLEAAAKVLGESADGLGESAEKLMEHGIALQELSGESGELRPWGWEQAQENVHSLYGKLRTMPWYSIRGQDAESSYGAVARSRYLGPPATQGLELHFHGPIIGTGLEEAAKELAAPIESELARLKSQNRYLAFEV